MEKTAIKNKQIIEILQHLYHEQFRGKRKFRFLIARDDLTSLVKKKRLSDDFIQNLADECLDEGLVFVDLGKNFLIESLDKYKETRKVTKELLRKYIQIDEIEDFTEN